MRQVYTQTDLDRGIRDGDIEFQLDTTYEDATVDIPAGTHVVCRKPDLDIKNNGWCLATERAYITAHKNSITYATRESQVNAYEHATVIASDRAEVNFHSNGWLVMDGDADGYITKDGGHVWGIDRSYLSVPGKIKQLNVDLYDTSVAQVADNTPINIVEHQPGRILRTPNGENMELPLTTALARVDAKPDGPVLAAYKCTDHSGYSGRSYNKPTHWAPGTIVMEPNMRTGATGVGDAGLYCGLTPAHALTEAARLHAGTRLFECRINLRDANPVTMPGVIQARKVQVIRELTI